ncbi:hypothetical protein ACFLX5_00290 [Chloroflexota bacterium]
MKKSGKRIGLLIATVAFVLALVVTACSSETEVAKRQSYRAWIPS